MTSVHETRDDTASRWHQVGHQQGFEEALAASVKELAKTFVAMSGPLWRIGDGCGGWVLEQIVAAAHEAGLGCSNGWTMSSRYTALSERDGWDCRYCGTPLGWGAPVVARPVVDHVMPRSRGGGNGLANLVLACGPCNSHKGARTPDEWLGEGWSDADEAHRAQGPKR